MIEFRLFRINIEKSLYTPNISRSDILKSIVNSKPRDRFKSNNVDAEWVVTNVNDIGQEALKFFLGRKQEIELSQLNKSGDIINRSEDDIPHATIFIHLPTGVAAIELNSEVASTSLAISKRLQILFGGSAIAKESGVRVRVSPVRISTDFTRRIQESHKLVMIQATYAKPNPPDAFRRVQQPVQDYLADLEGETAKVKFTGDDLEREPAVALATTAMRTGNYVSAKIQDAPGSVAEIIKSSEEEIAKFYVLQEALLREDSDSDVVQKMLKLLEEVAPIGGLSESSRKTAQQPERNF